MVSIFPAPNCVINFAVRPVLDGEGEPLPPDFGPPFRRIFAHQPYELRLTEPDLDLRETARGYTGINTRAISGFDDPLFGEFITRPPLGALLEVIWGEIRATPDCVTEIRELLPLGLRIDYEFSWTDPDGSSRAYAMVVRELETAFDWASGGFYQPVRMLAEELAPKSPVSD